MEVYIHTSAEVFKWYNTTIIPRIGEDVSLNDDHHYPTIVSGVVNDIEYIQYSSGELEINIFIGEDTND